MGFRSDFEKAGAYRFDGAKIQVLDVRAKDGSILYEMEVFPHEMKMTEQQEEHNMNEWDRLRLQAQRYKQDYPAGTRILLLRMGNDPRPVEDNMRGTVVAVDDIGTVHCKFDNGRQLGVIPGEDSFRKLTEAELTQEKNAILLKSFREKTAALSQVTDGMCCQVRSWQRKLYAECCHRVYYPLDPGSIRQGHWVPGTRYS